MDAESSRSTSRLPMRRSWQRVAAIDVAKASGMVCTRVPHPSSPGGGA